MVLESCSRRLDQEANDLPFLGAAERAPREWVGVLTLVVSTVPDDQKRCMIR